MRAAPCAPNGTGDEVRVVKGAVLRSRFGNRVRTLLGRSRRSADDLAELTTLPAGRIAKILDGNYVRLTIRDMELIASALGAPLHILLAPAELADDASTPKADDG